MEFKKVMQARRAVNFFDPQKDVSDAELKSVIETAALTPTAYNFQPYSLIVLRSPGDKERLKAVAFNQPKITETPVVLIVLGDKDGWHPGKPGVEKAFLDMVEKGYLKPEMRESMDQGAKALHEGKMKSLAFAAKYGAMFGLAILLAAKDAGLDSHPMEGFEHEEVRKAFNIPDNYFIPMLIAIGHFDESKTLGPPKWRKSYEELLFNT